jgi:hypothetical protein
MLRKLSIHISYLPGLSCQIMWICKIMSMYVIASLCVMDIKERFLYLCKPIITWIRHYFVKHNTSVEDIETILKFHSNWESVIINIIQ